MGKGRKLAGSELGPSKGIQSQEENAPQIMTYCGYTVLQPAAITPQLPTKLPPPSHQIRSSPEKSEFDAKGVHF